MCTCVCTYYHTIKTSSKSHPQIYGLREIPDLIYATCRQPWLKFGVFLHSIKPSVFNLHTTLYGSAAGCRSIQNTCAFWKHGLTFENTQSQLTYFCKSNINQTFTNGSGMIWGVMIAIFTEIRHLVEELITFLSFFGPQKLSILTARLNKSLSISTSYSVKGD